MESMAGLSRRNVRRTATGRVRKEKYTCTVRLRNGGPVISKTSVIVELPSAAQNQFALASELIRNERKIISSLFKFSWKKG
jgi:hypothetical protein